MKKLTVEMITHSILALICIALIIGVVVGALIHLIFTDKGSGYILFCMLVAILSGTICYRQFKSIIQEIAKL